MSTSLLYHGFGLTGYRYVRQEFREGQVIFHIEQPRERLRCAHCRSAAVWAQGGVPRTIRTVPIGGKPVPLQFKVPRVFNDKLSAFRRELYYQLGSDPDRKLLKGMRWLLLFSKSKILGIHATRHALVG